MARPAATPANLLWSWPRQAQFPHRRELASPDKHRVAVIVGDAGRARGPHGPHVPPLAPGY